MGFLSSFLGGVGGGAMVSVTIKAIDKYSSEVNKAKSGFSGLGMIAAGVLAAGLAVATKKLIELTKAGLESQKITLTFNTLMKDSAKTLERLNEASRGYIENTELMRSANKALSVGVKENQLPQLMAIAVAKAKELNMETTMVFDNLARGIATQRQMTLQTIGIIVQAEDAYKSYAESINKSIEALTKQEKNIAFSKAVIDQAIPSVLAMAFATESADEKVSGLSKIWKDFVSDISEVIANTLSFVIEQDQLSLAASQTGINYKELDKIISIHAERLSSLGDELKAVNKDYNDQLNLINGIKNEISGLSNVKLSGERQLEVDLLKAQLEGDEERASYIQEELNMISKRKQLVQAEAELKLENNKQSGYEVLTYTELKNLANEKIEQLEKESESLIKIQSMRQDISNLLENEVYFTKENLSNLGLTEDRINALFPGIGQFEQAVQEISGETDDINTKLDQTIIRYEAINERLINQKQLLRDISKASYENRDMSYQDWNTMLNNEQMTPSSNKVSAPIFVEVYGDFISGENTENSLLKVIK